jgi:hypothetical protein
MRGWAVRHLVEVDRRGYHRFGMKRRAPTLKPKRRARTSHASRQPPDDRESRRDEAPVQNPCEAGFRFDPYWDEVFAAYYDPTMGTCCRR